MPSPLLPAAARSLVVVRLRSLGDAVLLTPLLAALRAARPQLRIEVVLESPAAELLAGHPAIDEVLRARRGLVGRLALLAELRRRRHDVALDLHGGPTAARLTRCSGAALRIGLAGGRFDRCYDALVPRPEPARHTVAGNLAVARALGVPADPGLRPSLPPIDPRAAAAAAAALRSAGAPGTGFVLVHPWGAMASKTWPGERFAELARRLAGSGEPVVVAAAPDGRRLPLSHPAVALLSPLDVRSLAAVIARARLLVGNDSGPAHIAAALDVPAVAVFGSQDPRVWRPWPGGVAVWAGLPCSPCPGRTCRNPRRLECLEAITVDAVLAAVPARPRTG